MQEISGDDDAVDTGVGMIEMDEGVVKGQKIALKTAEDVTMKGNPVDKDGFGDVMVDETLVAIMADETTLVMANEAHVGTAHETALVMVGEASVGMVDKGTHVMVDEAHVGTTHETAPVMADEAFVGMADKAPVIVMVDPCLTIIAEFAAMDSHDQDANSVDSEETTSNEPQPL